MTHTTLDFIRFGIEPVVTHHAGDFLVDYTSSGCTLFIRGLEQSDHARLAKVIRGHLCDKTSMEEDVVTYADNRVNTGIRLIGGDILRTLLRLSQVPVITLALSAEMHGDSHEADKAKLCLITEKELWLIAGALSDKPTDELNKARIREGMDQLVDYFQTDKGRESLREEVDEQLITKMTEEARRVMRLPESTPQDILDIIVKPQIELQATRRERESIYAVQRYVRHMNDARDTHSFYEACKWARTYKHIQPFVKFACRTVAKEQDNQPLARAIRTLPPSFLEDMGVRMDSPPPRLACA